MAEAEAEAEDELTPAAAAPATYANANPAAKPVQPKVHPLLSFAQTTFYPYSYMIAYRGYVEGHLQRPM